MSFDSIEKSQASGEPFELYFFSTTGQSFFLAGADQEIAYLGENYAASTIHRDQMEETSEIDAGEVKVYLPTAHPLAQLFIPGLPPTPVQVTIYAGHYGDSEVVVFYTGTVASGTFGDECELLCRSDKYLLNRKVPKQIYQSLCNHIFGDPDCGVNLALFTYEGFVDAIDASETVLTISAFASIPAGILKGGYLKTGNQARAILSHAGSTVRIMAPIAGLVAGAACAGVAGCAHTYPACQGYNNVPNFLGFDLIPSINPFDETTSLG